MIIRRAQVEALHLPLRIDFEDRLIRHLEEVFPEKTAELRAGMDGDIALRRHVQKAILRAFRYHIEHERDVALFVDLATAIEPEFEQRDDMRWARNILLDDSLKAHAKVGLIYHLLPERNPDLVEETGETA